MPKPVKNKKTGKNSKSIYVAFGSPLDLFFDTVLTLEQWLSKPLSYAYLGRTKHQLASDMDSAVAAFDISERSRSMFEDDRPKIYVTFNIFNESAPLFIYRFSNNGTTLLACSEPFPLPEIDSRLTERFETVRRVDFATTAKVSAA